MPQDTLIDYFDASPERRVRSSCPPMRLAGDDFEALAKQVEDAVRRCRSRRAGRWTRTVNHSSHHDASDADNGTVITEQARYLRARFLERARVDTDTRSGAYPRGADSGNNSAGYQYGHVRQIAGSTRMVAVAPRVQLHSCCEASYHSGHGRKSVAVPHRQVWTE